MSPIQLPDLSRDDCPKTPGQANLGELVLGAGEADPEPLDFAQPTLALGLSDAQQQIVADLGDARSLCGIWPVHAASQAAVLVNALSGEDVLAILAEEAGQPLPGDTLTVRTPTGGLHLYYAVPAGVVLRSTAGERGNGLGWKIDTRAWGGYVVAPGSTTPDGRYEYLYDGPAATLPGWLVERLTPAPPPAAPVLPIRPARGRRSRYLDVAIRAEAGKVADATDNRNATLFAAALALGQLVAGGAVSEQEIRAALMTAAWRHIGTRQFSEREAHTTISSGLKAGPTGLGRWPSDRPFGAEHCATGPGHCPSGRAGYLGADLAR
jgi:hypothetical protein